MMALDDGQTVTAEEAVTALSARDIGAHAGRRSWMAC